MHHKLTLKKIKYKIKLLLNLLFIELIIISNANTNH